MSDLSRADLKKKIQAILKDADLEKTSAKKVRQELEDEMKCDLKDRKDEINDIINDVIDEQEAANGEDESGEEHQESEEGEEEEEEEESEEEKPKKRSPVKPKPQRKAAPSSDEESGEDSDGGGSDYEPDEPVKVRNIRGSARKKRNDVSSDESSGEEWGAKRGKGKGKRKKKLREESDASFTSDSDDDKPKAKKAKKSGGGGGFSKALKLSEDLADIVGTEKAPRHEVVKQMWAYIKENNLQDPKNKQFAICDDKLSKIIPTKRFKCFGMVKYLKDHMS